MLKNVDTTNADNIGTGTLKVDRLPTVPTSKGGTGATTPADARENLEITPANIGAAPISHATNATTYGAATAANWGHVRVGTNIGVSSGTISVANATTDAKGVVQLNNTLTSTDANLALTAAQGKVLKDALDLKYTKPAAGIPATDLTTTVRTSLGKADSALQKTDVVDNLYSNVNNVPLSANQGRVLKALLDGKNIGASFPTIDDLITSLNNSNQLVPLLDSQGNQILDTQGNPIMVPTNNFAIGFNLFVVDLDVPDFWVAGRTSPSVEYVYTTDQNFIDAVDAAASTGGLQVGPYFIGRSELGKIDLSDYQPVINLTPNRAVISSATGTLAVSATTSTHIGYLNTLTGNVQTQLNAKEATITAGTTAQYWRGDKSWQALNKSAVGLANVDNTSDANKPVSSATQTALNAKENTITAGTTAQYWRGDKSWQTLNKAAVGLGSVDNTSDANKPISTATQTALNAKENTITAGTAAQYWRGDKTWVALTKSAVGLANVDNTSDVNKPISTATQTALNAKENTITTGTAGQYWTGLKAWATLNSAAVGLGNVPNVNATNATNITTGTLAGVRMALANAAVRGAIIAGVSTGANGSSTTVTVANGVIDVSIDCGTW